MSKKYNRYVSKLNLTTPTEKYILECILAMDGRSIILSDILCIESYSKKFNSTLNLIWVELHTIASSYSFSLSNFNSLSNKKDIEAVKSNIRSDLRHKVYR